MPRRARTSKRQMLAAATAVWDGEWAVSRWGPNEIVLTNKAPPAGGDPTRGPVWREALNLCRLRVALRAGAEAVRQNVDRRVRWDCVQAVWAWLIGTPVTFSAVVADGCPVVWCSLWGSVHLMFDALTAANKWEKVDPQREGELWLRVGLDGVPIWKSHVVACTVAPCSRLLSLPDQSPLRHFVFCLLRGTEQVEVVEQLLQTASVIQDVTRLDGCSIPIGGKHYRVRVFLCGDHMLMYKIAGRDPPACTRDERRPCPYCDAPPSTVASLTCPAPPPSRSTQTHVCDRASGAICNRLLAWASEHTFYCTITPRSGFIGRCRMVRCTGATVYGQY